MNDTPPEKTKLSWWRRLSGGLKRTSNSLGTAVADLAREHGLILRPDGRFHALDEDGLTLFVLQNGDGGAFRADTLDTQQTSRLTLLLDVPRAPEAQRPFDKLVKLANELATAVQHNIRTVTVVFNVST